MSLSTVIFPIKAEIVADSTNPQQEMIQLEQYESLLKRCGDSAWESAAAIAEIIDRKLYRLVGYERFQDYCEVRLGVGRQWAYKLRKAHGIMQAISSEAQAETALVVIDGASRVASTRHETASDSPVVVAIAPSAVAELAPLSKPQQVAVLSRLQDQATDGTVITAQTVRATVKAERAASAAHQDDTGPTTQVELHPMQPTQSRAPQQQIDGRARKTPEQEAAEQAIANGSHGAAVLKQVRQSIKALRELPAMPGLEMLTSRKESVARHLESAATAITAYLPAIVCPKCHGACCPDCGNHGWLNKAAQRSLNSQSHS